MRELVEAAPSVWPYVESINNRILTGDMYKALKVAKTLIAYEQELIDNAKRSTRLQRGSQADVNPRELEADLLLKAASRLQAARRGTGGDPNSTMPCFTTASSGRFS